MKMYVSISVHAFFSKGMREMEEEGRMGRQWLGRFGRREASTAIEEEETLPTTMLPVTFFHHVHGM